MHTAVAAGFTAGWYIEHKLVLTHHGEEHTASHPGPDDGLSGSEDAAHDPARARCTRIGRPEGAAQRSIVRGSVHAPTPVSGSVYAATTRRLGIGDTVPRTGRGIRSVRRTILYRGSP